eukprot:g11266.t1
MKVPKNRKAPARFASSFECKSNETLITTRQVFNILSFELQHQYYVLGNAVIKQTLGLPMGKPPSPALANSLAVFQMDKWFLTNPIMRKYILVLRYVDDVLPIGVFFKHNDRITKIKMLDELNRLFDKDNLFKNPLYLKHEEVEMDGSINYLESNIVVNDDKIHNITN